MKYHRRQLTESCVSALGALIFSFCSWRVGFAALTMQKALQSSPKEISQLKSALLYVVCYWAGAAAFLFLALISLIYFFQTVFARPPPPQHVVSDDQEEIVPPWVKFPGYGPLDGFWRQPGEWWYVYVWLPYWEKLDEKEKKAYLERYNTPQEWLEDCFDITQK